MKLIKKQNEIQILIDKIGIRDFASSIIAVIFWSKKLGPKPIDIANSSEILASSTKSYIYGLSRKYKNIDPALMESAQIWTYNTPNFNENISDKLNPNNGKDLKKIENIIITLTSEIKDLYSITKSFEFLLQILLEFSQISSNLRNIFNWELTIQRLSKSTNIWLKATNKRPEIFFEEYFKWPNIYDIYWPKNEENTVKDVGKDIIPTFLSHQFRKENSKQNYIVSNISSYILSILNEVKNESIYDTVHTFISKEITLIKKQILKHYTGSEQGELLKQVNTFISINSIVEGDRFDTYSLTEGKYGNAHFFFISILLLFSDVRITPFQDPYIIEFTEKLLIDLLNQSKNVNDENMNEIIKSSENFCNEVQLRIDTSKFMDDKLRENPTVSCICNQFSVNKIIELFTQLVLSRITIINPKDQIGQFLYEELGGILEVLKEKQNLAKYVDDLYHKLSMLDLNKYDKEPIIEIDTASGPQQILRELTYPILHINAELGMYINAKIVSNIASIYENSANDQNFKNQFSNEILLSLRNEYLFIGNILDGNRYRDHYEYLSNRAVINDITSQLDKKNDLLFNEKTSNEKLDKQNQNLISTNKNLSDNIKTLNNIIKNYQLENKNLWNNWSDLKNQENNYINEIERLEKLLNRFDNIADEISLSADKFEWFLNKQGNQDNNLLSITKELNSNKKILLPSEALKLIEILCPERIIVLPETYEKLKKTDAKFTKGVQLFKMLCKLATEFYDAFFIGGDNKAKNVFTNNEYAADESETIKNGSNLIYGFERSACYNGQNIEMTRHLKIGVSNDISTTIRVYFFTTLDKKIVIGYCGPHPKNTKTSSQ